MRIVFGIVIFFEWVVGLCRGFWAWLGNEGSGSLWCCMLLDWCVKDGGRGFHRDIGYLERLEENYRNGKLNLLGRILYRLRKW